MFSIADFSKQWYNTHEFMENNGKQGEGNEEINNNTCHFGVALVYFLIK